LASKVLNRGGQVHIFEGVNRREKGHGALNIPLFLRREFLVERGPNQPADRLCTGLEAMLMPKVVDPIAEFKIYDEI
jgi:hypothetical protein